MNRKLRVGRAATAALAAIVLSLVSIGPADSAQYKWRSIGSVKPSTVNISYSGTTATVKSRANVGANAHFTLYVPKNCTKIKVTGNVTVTNLSTSKVTGKHNGKDVTKTVTKMVKSGKTQFNVTPGKPIYATAKKTSAKKASSATLRGVYLYCS